jgi:hypothetical protein
MLTAASVANQQQKVPSRFSNVPVGELVPPSARRSDLPIAQTTRAERTGCDAIVAILQLLGRNAGAAGAPGFAQHDERTSQPLEQPSIGLHPFAPLLSGGYVLILVNAVRTASRYY